MLCTGNSARSQMAEALFRDRGRGRISAASAGTAPAACVNPGAVDVLARHGIRWEGHRPRHTDAIAGERWDVAVTVCDEAKEGCPLLPGAEVQVHWGMPDPAAVDGDAQRAAFDAAYSTLERRVRAALELPLETMTPAERRAALAALVDDPSASRR